MKVSRKIGTKIKPTLFIIMSVFISSFLTAFVFDDIVENLEEEWLGESDIVINVIENVLGGDEFKIEKMNKFSISFITFQGQAKIIFYDLGRYDNLPPFAFSPNLSYDKPEYYINIVNQGDRTEKNIKLTFTGENVEENFKGTASKFIYGGHGDTKYCIVEQAELKPNEGVGIFFEANTSPELSLDPHRNYRIYYTRCFIGVYGKEYKNVSIEIMGDDGEMTNIVSPPFNNDSNPILYRYTVDAEWVKIPETEYSIIYDTNDHSQAN